MRLWTSDEKGIDSTRVLPRSLRLVTWEREKTEKNSAGRN